MNTNAVGVYCRISTDQQRDNTSIPEQKRIGQEFAANHGFLAKLYVDEAVSGATAIRENYQRLIKDIEAGSLSAVWVVAADRYGRNVEESSRFKSLLLRHRIRLFIKDSEVNLLSPDGRFSQNVRDAVSEFEKDLIRDRTLNSRRTNVNNGHKRTHSIYGYDDFYDSQGSHKLRINEAEAKVVRHIFRLYKRGKSFKKIARALNDEGIPTKFKGKIVKDRITKQPRVINTKWSHSHISYIIRRPEYAGFQWDWEHKNLIPALDIPAIIDMPQAEWSEMASKISILAAERNRNGYKSADHQLTGIVRCSACNSQYFYWRNAERTKFYYKHHASSTRERQCKQIPKCINAKAFENLFELCTLITLFSVFETESYVKKQLRQIEDNSREALLTSKDLIAQRAKIIAAIERLLDAVETQGASPEIRDRLSKRQAERQEIDDRLRLHENQSAKAKQDILELQIAFGTDTAQALREANGDVKRRLYISLLESASVKNGVLTLVYRNGKTFSIGIPQRSNTISRNSNVFPVCR